MLQMRLPWDFREFETTVMCVRCSQQWRIPPGMAELTPQGWKLLLGHYNAHRAHAPRQIVIVNPNAGIPRWRRR